MFDFSSDYDPKKIKQSLFSDDFWPSPKKAPKTQKAPKISPAPKFVFLSLQPTKPHSPVKKTIHPTPFVFPTTVKNNETKDVVFTEQRITHLKKLAATFGVTGYSKFTSKDKEVLRSMIITQMNKPVVRFPIKV
jgi:hypothetical protein